MPCYQVKTYQLDLNLANKNLLIAALQDLGFDAKLNNQGAVVFPHGRGWATVENGQITMTSYDRMTKAEQGDLVNSIKGGYAKQAVKVAAKRFGFSVTTSKTDDNKLTLKKGF